MKNKMLLYITGPTGIGKSKMSLLLAKKLKTEIISSDSRQFYKEMTIGTAVPSKEELKQVKHHFIQHKSIFDNYNINDYNRDVDSLIKILSKKKKYIVLVGGSNLYLKSIIYGLDNIPKTPNELREKLNFEFKTKGIEYIQQLLKKLDINYYKNVDLQNHRRIIRALEVSIFTKKPFSSFLKGTKKEKYKHHSIVLNLDRDILYKRINNRVDYMFENRLIDEVKKLFEYKDLNPLNTIGYKELFNYLNGDCSIEKSVEQIKMNSRRFAKKQYTWLNNNGNHIWLDASKTSQSNINTLFQKIF